MKHLCTCLISMALLNQIIFKQSRSQIIKLISIFFHFNWKIILCKYSEFFGENPGTYQNFIAQVNKKLRTSGQPRSAMFNLLVSLVEEVYKSLLFCLEPMFSPLRNHRSYLKLTLIFLKRHVWFPTVIFQPLSDQDEDRLIFLTEN